MSASLRFALRKIAIALVALWFFNEAGDWYELFIYAGDLDTNSIRLVSKRIRVRIEIVNNPSLEVRE